MDASAEAGDAEAPCEAGAKRCSQFGTAVETCGPTGAWLSDECASPNRACLAGACTGQASCRVSTIIMPCGLSGSSCCASGIVYGGTFNRSNDASYPATVGDFELDVYEVTVGRFRLFVEAYPADAPLRVPTGAGAHPSNPGSGWSTEWTQQLPANRAALLTALKCLPAAEASWTDVKGVNEKLPINCVTWYEAFAFCAWDSGRLPTESEWNYAAAGGLEQRVYPWSGSMIDSSYAVFDVAAPAPVGTKPQSQGRWGQYDLVGNVSEMVLDGWRDPYRTGGCGDCTSLTPTTQRVLRGGAFNQNASAQTTLRRIPHGPATRSTEVGFRCAHSL